MVVQARQDFCALLLLHSTNMEEVDVARLPLRRTRVVRDARWLTCSKRRKSESGKSSRFFPRSRVGTDRGQTVHPLRAADGLNASDGHGLAFSPRATPIGRRAEEQHVPKCSGVRRR